MERAERGQSAVKESVKPTPNQRLKHEREIHNWTQEQVAEKVGTTPLNVGRWERGIWLIGEVLCPWGEFCLQQQQLQLASAVVQDVLKIAPKGGQELVATAQYSLAIFQTIGYRKTSQVRRWLKTLSDRF